ncbi:MAG: 50S ribosomal protein L3 N(5)-glutamine methyltransferase [Gammaproteobacteria bacterium]|nr:50S ribosomal protein L3 N(5)-glutamine methyltransferase [Gammaproteobacteria bacterium]
MSPHDIDEAVNDLRSLGDFIRWAASALLRSEVFFGHGTDNGWDEALALCLHPLRLEHQDLEAARGQRLTRSERREIAELVARRINERLPLAYLTNKIWFAGLEFYVDERVLVPRSPIAELIENGFQPWLGERIPARVLDLCTGSGCIAIALAHAFPGASVDAADISTDALDVAAINVGDHGLDEQVSLVESDVFSGLQGEVYDLIVSNPPYVDAGDIDSMPEEFRHEPMLGLAAGDDGLDIVRRILREAPEHLSEDGLLIVEVGNSEAHVQTAWPEVPFLWLEFTHGGQGVFLIEAADLRAFHDRF